jgi:hypothetical protein
VRSSVFDYLADRFAIVGIPADCVTSRLVTEVDTWALSRAPSDPLDIGTQLWSQTDGFRWRRHLYWCSCATA